MRVLILLALAAVCAGCSSLPKPPSIKQATITPPQLMPGDTAYITVAIQDRFGIVHRVAGSVKEDPAVTFQLRDDGQPPDEAADDDIWSLQVDVPFSAPAGQFQIDLTAFDSDGAVIAVRDENGDAVPLQATLSLGIRWPSSEPQPAPQP